MKKIYAMIMATIMILASSCTTKNSDSSSNEEAVSTSEAVVEYNDTSDNSENGVAESQVATASEDVVMTRMVNNGKPSVIDFSATWCGPCKMMKPIFHKLAAEYADKYNFITIDIDEEPGLADKYHIQAVPTFIFIDADGEEGDRITGAVEESELRDQLQNPAWF